MKKRFLIIAGICCGIATLLCGAGEALARALAPQIAAEAIRNQLKLDTSQKIDVKFEGILLLQLISGKMRNVTVAIPNYKLTEGVQADVTAKLNSVPLAVTSTPLEDGKLQVEFTSKQFAAALKKLAPEYIDSAEIKTGTVNLVKNFNLFGSHLAANATVQAHASADGKLVITPQTITAGGITVEPAKLPNLVGGQLAELARKFGGENQFCLGKFLPSGIHLKHLETAENRITAVFQLDPHILMKPELLQNGSC